MKIYVGLMIAAIALQGCTGNVWYVDERFTDEEQVKVQAGADLWSTATDEQVVIDLVFGQRVDLTDENKRVLVKTSRRAGENFTRERNDNCDSYYYTNKVNREFIVIYTDLPPEALHLTVAHELGHSLGLKHIENGDALMNPGTDEESCITRLDLEALHHEVDFDMSRIVVCGE